MKKPDFSIWLQAARPQTLPAAFVPVLVGSSLAMNDLMFRWDTSSVALLCALLIQTGTNFANDYYDHIKGADTPDRIGFVRATSAGLVKPKAMLFATYLTMFTAFIAGLYLVWVGGWVILVIGLLSLLFGILYTGGPYPLGYNGLGDVFVFIFFGVVAVMGTYYVNALAWSSVSFWVSVPIGAICVNILVVNNLRDVDQDKITGKRTLGVLLGETALKAEYSAFVLIAYAVPVFLYFTHNFDYLILLPLLLTPVSYKLIQTIWMHEDKRVLNQTLERTAMFMVLYGILFSAGIILG